MACDKLVPISNMYDVWDASGNYKVAIKMDVSDISSAYNSKLIDLLVGGLTKFSVDKSGVIQTASRNLWLRNASQHGFGITGSDPSIYISGQPILSFSAEGIYPFTSNQYSLGIQNKIFNRIYQTTISDSLPDITNYPHSGSWGVHRNTSNETSYIAYNNGTGIDYIGFNLVNVSVFDEGSLLTNRLQNLNFVGSGVTATITGNVVTVNIPGGGGAGTFTGVSTDDTIIGDGYLTPLSVAFSDDSGNIITLGSDNKLYVSSTAYKLTTKYYNSIISQDTKTYNFSGIGVIINDLGGGEMLVNIPGTDTFTNPTPMPQTLGGLSAGTTFNMRTLTGLVNDLLYPYQSPAFTSFSFNQTTPIEVGNSIVAGTKTFSWATSNSANVQPNTVDIEDVTNATVLADNIANDGSENIAIGSITKTSATSHTWRISALNTNSVSFNRTFSVAWQWRIYYGESLSGTLNESLIESLRVNTLSATANGDYSFLGGGYKYLCYPTAMGLRTTFTDQLTKLNVAMETPYTVSVTNAYGVNTDYYVHRTTNILGSSIVIEVSA